MSEPPSNEPAISARELIDAFPVAAAVLDDALAIVACNARFLELMGLEESEAPGRSLRDPLPRALTSLVGAASGAAKGRLEIARAARFRRGDAELRADVSFVPIPVGGGRGVLVTALDVSDAEAMREQLERRRADESRLEQHVEERTREVMALQEQQAHAHRLAAVGQLAAGVMHDVNNALNPIMVAAYLLEAKADDPDAVRDYAARIAKAAETAAATTSRVGRFIRQDPTQGAGGEQVDLAAVADEVVQMTRPLWAERNGGGVVHLERDLAPGAVVRGLPGELREAVLHLVQNALDAMPQGGRLSLRTGASADEAVVEVTDSGAGMDDEVRRRAFDPYFSTKGSSGSGLGLAEVYGIVRRHGGRAEIESVPGAGTTVRLRFPLENRGGPAPRDAARRAEPRRVLVVEDHVDGRDFMRTVLELDGHAVDAVGTVADAAACLALDDPTVRSAPFDVVVTDVGLPDGSGWDLVARARERWPALRLGIVTGWEPTAPGSAGYDFAMQKPVRPNELLAEVAAV